MCVNVNFCGMLNVCFSCIWKCSKVTLVGNLLLGSAQTCSKNLTNSSALTRVVICTERLSIHRSTQFVVLFVESASEKQTCTQKLHPQKRGGRLTASDWEETALDSRSHAHYQTNATVFLPNRAPFPSLSSLFFMGVQLNFATISVLFFSKL